MGRVEEAAVYRGHMELFQWGMQRVSLVLLVAITKEKTSS